MICGARAHALRASGWWKAHFPTSVNKITQDGRHINGNRGTRSDVHRHIQSLLKYAQASEENYGVRFVDVRVTDTVEDMLFSNLFNFKCKHDTYVTMWPERWWSSTERSPLLGKLSKDPSTAKTLGITHLNDHSLYISSVQHFLFLIYAANALDENVRKRASFQERVFIGMAGPLLWASSLAPGASKREDPDSGDVSLFKDLASKNYLHFGHIFVHQY